MMIICTLGLQEFRVEGVKAQYFEMDQEKKN